jgi:D-amino-acid oxidase
MLYVVPRPGTGTTILGGCKQVGNWSEEVDKELNERIVARMKRFGLCDELRGQGGDFEVLSYQVGFRPGRTGGPRVEVEDKGRLMAFGWCIIMDIQGLDIRTASVVQKKCYGFSSHSV